jgi:aryl carrier-like protein
MFVTPYPSQNSFKLMQIGVKFKADGETIDFQTNLKTFKYWKNALAPLSELYAEMVTS